MADQIQYPIQPPSVPQQVPEVSKEQKELLDALNNLLLSAQELSFAVALIPTELVEKHSELNDLIESSKNVVRSAYRLYKIIKGARK